jgi:hypothetical protein
MGDPSFGVPTFVGIVFIEPQQWGCTPTRGHAVALRQRVFHQSADGHRSAGNHGSQLVRRIRFAG